MSVTERQDRFRAVQWIRQHAREIFYGPDFLIASIAALGALVLGLLSSQVRALGLQAFLTLGALGVAFLAVTLTAMAILVAFMGDEYLEVLNHDVEGVEGALRPYKIVALLAAGTTFLSIAGALLYVVSPVWLQAFFLAAVVLVAVWTLGGAVQLVFITASHGLLRAELLKGLSEAKSLLENRRQERKQAG